MSDKKNKNSADEYHFPDEEYLAGDAVADAENEHEHGEDHEGKVHEDDLFDSNDEQEVDDDEESEADVADDDQSEAPKPSFLVRYQKVVFTVVGIIVVFVLYHSMTKHHIVVKRKPVPHPVATPAKKPAPVEQQPQQQPIQMQPAVAQSSPQLLSSVSQLRHSEEESNAQIAALEDQVNGLRAHLRQSEQQTDHMSQVMLSLSKRVKQLDAQLNSTPSKGKTPPAPRLVYHVRVIISGRAWVVDNYGESLTVKVGDTVPEYGSVESIDPNSGVITTTSGKLIQYGQNDD